MNCPTVSIIIPTYNRAAFIGRAIESVRQQNWSDYELIVVDDGSTDETPMLVKALAETDKRIRVINHHKGRHGPAGARNAGLAEARGDWVAFLDSDDEWLPGKLESFMQAAVDGVALIGSNYHIIEDEQGAGRTMWEFITTVMIPWWINDPLIQRVINARALQSDAGLLGDPDMVRMMTLGGFLWPQTSSVMVRRSDVEAVGRFDARLTRTEDMDLWLKLLNRGRFVYIDQVLARYNTQGRDGGGGSRYENQLPERRHDSYGEMLAHLRFLKTLPRRFSLSNAAKIFHRDRIRTYHAYCENAASDKRPIAKRWHHWNARTWPRIMRTLTFS